MSVLHTTAFPFLSELHRRLEGRTTAPPEVLRAVTLLTATADPARADRLAPRPGEPAVLVERLATWALHRVDPEAIAIAGLILNGGPSPVAQPTAVRETAAV